MSHIPLVVTGTPAYYDRIASTDAASSLSAYMTNDAGIAASRNQIVMQDLSVGGVNTKRKGLNVYLESAGQASGSNYDGLQVNVGATITANTSASVGQFEAAEFYMSCSGTAVTLPQMNGIKVRTTVTGSATVNNVTGILLYLPQFNAGSTTTNYSGFFLDTPSGGGTLTNMVAGQFVANTGGITNTNAYGLTCGGHSAALIADDSTATGSFIGHGPVGGGSMPFTFHDGWYGFAGSPEGSLSANVGSMYSRQDSTIGDAFYVKAAGSSNTMWAPSATISPIKTVSTTYSATNSDGTILCTGTFIVTLASTGVPTGKTFRLKNISTGTITVSSAVNIDFSTTYVLSSVGQSVDVQWDGTQWWVF